MSCRRKRTGQHCPWWAVLALNLVVALPVSAAPPDVVWPDGEQPLLAGPGGDTLSGEQILAVIDSEGLPDDPRLLGRALRVLRMTPASQRDAHSWWLQGRIEQRLHRFDSASRALARASALAPDNLSYLLEQFYVALAGGDGTQAKVHCDRIGALQASLLAASCAAQWQLQFASAEQAQALIEKALASAGRGANEVALLDALITRADILSRRSDDGAIAAWLRVLSRSPENHYARDQLARQLLAARQYADAETVTRDHQSLGLLVSRLIALRALDDPRATPLQQRLMREFRLARWRGDGLHRNEHVRFLAQVLDDKPAALALARQGWQEAPTPENRRVLLQLASQMGKTTLVSALIRDVRQPRPETGEASF